MRVALKISYNGTHFFGSQTQKETPHTILGNIEQVLKQLGIDASLVASGRTDKGVHALGQVCHLDIPEFWQDLVKFRHTLNKMLPSSIYIKKVHTVSSDFHARYSAKRRTYRYLIKKGDSNPFESDFVTFLEDIDFKNIQENMKLFMGKHDFKNFMKQGSDINSSTRIIHRAFAYKHKDYTVLNFQANGFLRSQIRLMVGALLNLNATQLQEKLELKHNHKVKPAPPNGLYLSVIHYIK